MFAAGITAVCCVEHNPADMPTSKLIKVVDCGFCVAQTYFCVQFCSASPKATYDGKTFQLPSIASAIRISRSSNLLRCLCTNLWFSVSHRETRLLVSNPATCTLLSCSLLVYRRLWV